MSELITEEQFQAAAKAKDEAQEVINTYFKQKRECFDERYKRFEARKEFFAEEELLYAARTRCPCGHGLAYPKNCANPHHHWECSAMLKGVQDNTIMHSERYPFSMYSIKSEDQPSAEGQTTRGTVNPSPELIEVVCITDTKGNDYFIKADEYHGQFKGEIAKQGIIRMMQRHYNGITSTQDAKEAFAEGE